MATVTGTMNVISDSDWIKYLNLYIDMNPNLGIFCNNKKDFMTLNKFENEYTFKEFHIPHDPNRPINNLTINKCDITYLKCIWRMDSSDYISGMTMYLFCITTNGKLITFETYRPPQNSSPKYSYYNMRADHNFGIFFSQYMLNNLNMYIDVLHDAINCTNGSNNLKYVRNIKDVLQNYTEELKSNIEKCNNCTNFQKIQDDLINEMSELEEKYDKLKNEHDVYKKKDLEQNKIISNLEKELDMYKKKDITQKDLIIK